MSSIDYEKEYRPEFHFTPKKNWINDPNGLVYKDGEYHLFFQHNPFDRYWGHMSWGHAVSSDLINWKELQVAIPEEGDEAIFSGSAVIDANNTAGFGKDAIVAIYTSHYAGETEKQAQSIAFSLDNGRTFTKYENNPVLDLNLEHFRDPKVFWDAPRNRWVMVVVKSREFTCCIYTSTNLKEWKLESEFANQGAVGGQWECPDLFPLTINNEEVWVLIISLSPGGVRGGAGTQYFIGDFNGSHFTPRYDTTSPRWVDYGHDNYAGVTYNNSPDGRRIMIGWMKSWQDGEDHPETPWNGALTIPRELSLTTLNGEIVLAAQPVREYKGPLLELEFDATVPYRQSLNGFATIGFDPSTSEIFVDDFAAPVVPVDGKVRVKALIDRCSIELFTEDGTRWITMVYFPTPGSDRSFTH